MYIPSELKVENLTLFRSGELLWHQLHFTLKNGEALIIQGANGSGKSSLLQVLCGRLLPYAGTITWHGNPIAGENHSSYLEQLFYGGHVLGLKNDLSVLANIKWRMALSGCSTSASDIAESVKKLNLLAYQHKTLHQLSYGQKRRVLMACLLLNLKALNKSVWILDEPLVGLDTVAILEMKKAFQQHLDKGGIFIITSHQPVDLIGGYIKILSLPYSLAAPVEPVA